MTTITCPEFETRLQACLDHRRDPTQDEQLVVHGWHCPGCQEKLELQSLMLSALPQVNLASLELAFGTSGANEQFTSHPMRADDLRAIPGQRRFDMLAALAIAVMLGLFCLNVLWHRDAATPQIAAAERSIEQPASVAAPPELDNPSVVDTKAPGAMEELVRRVSQSPEFSSLSTQVARPFRPVATSVVSAFGVIRQTLPVTRAS